MAVTSSMESTDAELVRSVYDELRRFAAVVAPWDFDPDDVLHAVLVSVLQKRSLVSVAKPVAYLQAAIVNHVRSEIRRKQTGRRLVDLLSREHAAVNAPDYPSDLADLMGLQPVERAVLYLHDIEGMTFEEVADAIGISAGNARVTASRARRSLKKLLEGER